MTRVKVCGLTREGDVRCAAALGVWACGFVLTDSPRAVRPAGAARLVTAAGSALTVGVFSVEPAARVAAAARAAGVGAVQLSAGADGPTVAAVRAAFGDGPAPVVIAAADTPDAAAADLVLLDARLPGVYGGTGTTLDWQALVARGGPQAAGRPVVLAGGLTAGNVGAAVAALRPYAVDVSGGVETAPGVKDPHLIAAFVAAVAAADGLPPAATARPRSDLAPPGGTAGDAPIDAKETP